MIEAELSSVCGASLSSALGQWARLSAAARAGARRGALRDAAAEEEARGVLSELLQRRRAAAQRMLRCIGEAEEAVAAVAAAQRLSKAVESLRSAQRDIEALGSGASALLLQLPAPAVAAAGEEATGSITTRMRRRGISSVETANALTGDALGQLEKLAAEMRIPLSSSSCGGGRAPSTAANQEEGDRGADPSAAAAAGPRLRDAVRRAMAEARALRAEQRALAAVGVAAPVRVSADCARALNGLLRTADAYATSAEDAVVAKSALVRQHVALALASPGGKGTGARPAEAGAAAVAAAVEGGSAVGADLSSGEPPPAKMQRCADDRGGSGSACAPAAPLFAAAAVAKEGLLSALEAVAVLCHRVQEARCYLVRRRATPAPAFYHHALLDGCHRCVVMNLSAPHCCPV